jgi:hypothetical protein
MPGQENKIKLPEETTVNQAAEVSNPNATEPIQPQEPAQQVQPNVLPQAQTNNFQTEQPIEEVLTKDDYTYIPSSNPAVDVLKQKDSSLDNYTYIPSQENVLKKATDPAKADKYIPSQVGTKFTKTYDNSGLQKALDKADRAEKQAIEILNGKFPGI